MSNPHYDRATQLNSDSKFFSKLSFAAAILTAISSAGIIVDAEFNHSEAIHVLKDYVQPEAVIEVPFAVMAATTLISYCLGENAATSRRMGHMG